MCSSCPQISIWDDGLDWDSQPPELKALGKHRAERVKLRFLSSIHQKVCAQLELEHATMTPEHIKAKEQKARQIMNGIAARSGSAKRWFDDKTVYNTIQQKQ